MGKMFLIKIFVFFILFILLDNSIFFIFKKGLDKYNGFGRNTEVLISGSSVSIAGYDVSRLENGLNKKVALYAQNGASVGLRYTMLKHFINKNKRAVKTVIYEVTPYMFSTFSLEANGYKMFYPYMDDKDINAYILSEEPKYSDYILHKYLKTSRLNNTHLKYSIQGYMGFYGNVKNLTVDKTTLNKLNEKQNTEPILLDKSKIKIIEQSINLMLDNNIRIILVNFPMTSSLKNYFRTQDYSNFLSFLQNLDREFPNVTLIDMNVDEFDDYHLFSDRGHLNSSGQKKFTEEIISKLKLANY